MKKHLSIILTILLVSSFFAAPVVIKAQPSSIPHEDPQAAQSTIDAFSFLSQYVEIFGLMANGQYGNASELSEKLSQIDVPEEYRFIIDRYNDLTQQLITTLNSLDSTLTQASTLLDQYRLDEARQKIDEAGVLVAKAQILLNDLQEATQTLSQRLGIFSSPVEDKARQAYQQLQSLLDRLNELIDRYHQLLQTTNQKIEGSQQIILTNLSINSDTSEAFVGSTLQVSGTLTTSSGQQLANRAIQILLDGDVIATANTASNGAFHTQIHAPYRYVDHFSINALYTPQGNDRGTYQSSVSPTIQIKLLYYQTSLSINAPSIAYPGLAMVVQANVTAQDKTPLNARQVRAFLNGTQIGQSQTDETGICTIKYTILAQAKLGNYTLTVKVDPSGTYADATRSKTIYIEKRTTNLQINSPSLLILPAQLQISGFAQSTSGPLKNANIIVEFANITSNTKTSNNGNFSITLDVPFSTVFAGNQELKIIAQPVEPWQATTQKTTNLLVVNAIGIAVALASGVIILALTFAKYAKSPAEKQKKQTTNTPPTPTPPEMQASTLTSKISPQTSFEGAKGRVLKAYINAAAAIQSTTKENLTASMTLREYLKRTTPKIKTNQPFTTLTGLAEKSLYSPHPTKSQDADQAEELANTIKEETA